MSRETTGITIGSIGFAAAIALILIGAFTHTDTTLITGTVLAAATAITCLLLQFTSPKEVNREQDPPMVEEPHHP